MVTYVWYVLVGLLAGAASALLGIGGGVIMVPALIVLFSMETHRATATSLAWIAPIALAGALLAWYHRTPPRWSLVLLAAPAGMAGAFLGRWLAVQVPGAYVKILFALLMLFVGVRLGREGIHELRNPAPVNAESPADTPS